MTQHSGYHENSLANPVYQTNGSPKTSETYWPNQAPELQDIHTRGDNVSSQVGNIGTHHNSSQSNNGVILVSRRRLHSNGSYDLIDRSQNLSTLNRLDGKLQSWINSWCCPMTRLAPPRKWLGEKTTKLTPRSWGVTTEQQLLLDLDARKEVTLERHPRWWRCKHRSGTWRASTLLASSLTEFNISNQNRNTC